MALFSALFTLCAAASPEAKHVIGKINSHKNAANLWRKLIFATGFFITNLSNRSNLQDCQQPLHIDGDQYKNFDGRLPRNKILTKRSARGRCFYRRCRTRDFGFTWRLTTQSLLWVQLLQPRGREIWGFYQYQ